MRGKHTFPCFTTLLGIFQQFFAAFRVNLTLAAFSNCAIFNPSFAFDDINFSTYPSPSTNAVSASCCSQQNVHRRQKLTSREERLNSLTLLRVASINPPHRHWIIYPPHRHYYCPTDIEYVTGRGEWTPNSKQMFHHLLAVKTARCDKQ